jgi:AraC family transcriptional regulator of adaptative response/methylated-DNA-[protein]-cysteine methyltransferase
MTILADQALTTPATPFDDDEARWRAVLARDPHAEGRFWLGVTSTGVFCRPTCPARRPRRDRARFFDSTAAAGAAGFRPCRRCRPTERVRTQLDVVAEACRIIEAHADEPGGGPSLTELGRLVGWSPFHLQRTFRRIVGVSPRQYAENRRVERLRGRLRDGDSVTDALYGAGWGSSAAFYASAPAHLGMSPSAYRHGADGTLIRYTVVDSPVGRLLIARTERGICAINLGDDDASLARQLRREFVGATTERDDEGLRVWAEAVLAGLDGAQPHAALPLDVRASAFQRRVWQALRAIPYGETRTYGQVAAAIGSPGAARAVGRACATNPVALVVPCHRVVASGGNLGGYASGVERKRWLLDHEADVSKAPEA